VTGLERQVTNTQMAYQDNNRFQRQMFDITSLGITCAECGAAITQLPFEPTKKEDGTFGKLYCYEQDNRSILLKHHQINIADLFLPFLIAFSIAVTGLMNVPNPMSMFI
jgi:hypothetical protein